MRNSGMNGRPDAQEVAGGKIQPAGAQPPIPIPQPTPAQSNRRREVTFALVALVLVVGLAESMLRLAGFRFIPVPTLTDLTWGPKQLKAMNEDAGREVFQPDDLLFWSMIPGSRHRDNREVNDLGLLNGPVQIPKPAGVYRILCLGDSCTAIGPVAYPMALQKRLDVAARPDRRFEVVNAGVYSYTSLQGLRLFRHRLAKVQPDLVTVYYGWNDHYLTAGCPDKLLRSREAPAPGIIRLLRYLRLYQLVRQVVNRAQLQAIGEMRVRVAPEDYRENLCAIADTANELGARTILLTAPSNHSPGHVPDSFVTTRKAESEEALIVRHRNYNTIVREIAGEKKTELVDFDSLFNAHNKDLLFMRDGLHPNGRGRHLLAETLAARLGEMGVLSADDQKTIAEKFTYDSSDPNWLHSRIEILNGPLHAAVGQPLEIAVKATNAGDTIWLAHPESDYGRVHLGIVISSLKGQYLFERERGNLERDVRPGETIELRWPFSPIEQPGRYVLDVCGVAEFIEWFNETGNRRTSTTLVVEPARPQDAKPPADQRNEKRAN